MCLPASLTSFHVTDLQDALVRYKELVLNKDGFWMPHAVKMLKDDVARLEARIAELKQEDALQQSKEFQTKLKMGCFGMVPVNAVAFQAAA